MLNLVLVDRERHEMLQVQQIDAVRGGGIQAMYLCNNDGLINAGTPDRPRDRHAMKRILEAF